MSPRIRQISDDAVLAAAAVIRGKIGPAVTLADVAAKAGLAPATLIQRYGSKRGLMLELARRTDGIPDSFAAARAVNVSPLDALIACLCERANTLAPDPTTYLNLLTSELTQLADPDFRRVAVEQQRKFLAELRDLLDEAVSWGELRECDTAALAITIKSLLDGALANWCVSGEGTAAESVRGKIDLLLAAYRES